MRVISPLFRICLMVGVLSLMALAQQKSTSAPSIKPTSQFVSSGQKVFVDPQTKQIVQPTQEQIRALDQAAISKGTAFFMPAQPTRVISVYGVEGVMLDESTLSYAVATKTADGKVSFRCIEGKDKVSAMPQTTSSKEKLDEK